MKRSWVLKMIFLAAVLAAASLACEFSGDNKTSNGERAFFNEQGFSFTPPAGTTVSNLGFIGAEVHTAKEDKSGDLVLGPKCFASTGSSSHFNLKDSPDKYWASAIASEKNNSGLSLGDYQETSVAGNFAVEGEETGNYLVSVDPKANPIYGKRLDIQLEGKQVVTLICDGLLTRKAETVSLYEALKASLQFFAPMTPTPEK